MLTARSRRSAPRTAVNTAAQARCSQQGEQGAPGRRDEEAAGLGAADAQRDAVWKPTSVRWVHQFFTKSFRGDDAAVPSVRNRHRRRGDNGVEADATNTP